MPTYEVRDLKTGEDTEILCSHASLQEKIDSGRFVQIHKSTANLVFLNLMQSYCLTILVLLE